MLPVTGGHWWKTMILAGQDLGRIKTSSLLGFIFSPYPSNEVSGSPHFYSNNATLGSILDIQLSRKSVSIFRGLMQKFETKSQNLSEI